MDRHGGGGEGEEWARKVGKGVLASGSQPATSLPGRHSHLSSPVCGVGAGVHGGCLPSESPIILDQGPWKGPLTWKCACRHFPGRVWGDAPVRQQGEGAVTQQPQRLQGSQGLQQPFRLVPVKTGHLAWVSPSTSPRSGTARRMGCGLGRGNSHDGRKIAANTLGSRAVSAWSRRSTGVGTTAPTALSSPVTMA